MSDMQVIEKLEKDVKEGNEKKVPLRKRLKNILIEMLIIVFSVSLSLSFHIWNENAQEQTVVKNFLEGLRSDILKDKKEMTKDKMTFNYQKRIFEYLLKMPAESGINADSIDLFKDNLFNRTRFGNNSGRYEGFKSSGKLYFIKDKELLNIILDYYEEDIPLLATEIDYYKDQKAKISEFIINNSDNYLNENFLKALSNPSVKNRGFIYLKSIDNIIDSYDKCEKNAEEIINKIDKLLK